MKTKIWILLGLGLILPALGFAKGNAVSEEPSSFYAGIGGMVDQPLTSWDTGTYIGVGGSLFGGMVLQGPWSAQVNVDELVFSGAGNTLYNARFLGEAKYTFKGASIEPYLLGGAGCVYQAISPSSLSTVNPDVVLGAGFQCGLGDSYHFFIEAKDNFIIPQGSVQMDVPITTGIWTSL
jgi:hypothetical protein